MLTRITLAQERSALDWLGGLWGINYGHAEVAPGTAAGAVRETDCSELSERLFNDHLGVPLPDGSMAQLDYCRRHGQKLHWPEDALRTFDLLFLVPPLADPTADPSGAPIYKPGGMGHVAIVAGVLTPSAAGGVMLIEARGKPWGKVIYSPLRRVVRQFEARFAGIWRLVECETGPV